MTLTYAKAEKINLKNHPEFNESWVRDRIFEDPAILGLGNLDVKDVERMQPKAGRLDLLLRDPETDKRYEVELMLGVVDESHIIRTLEYWDIERKRYPQYDHTAVIIAEDITTRFLNVISLFNSVVPVIALQMNALKLDGHIILHFTRVLDAVLPGADDENESGEVTDRSWWEKKGSKRTLTIVDGCLTILREIDGSINLKYNKYYIGLTDQSGVNNFIAFRPRKQYVLMSAYSDDRQSWQERLAEVGIAIVPESHNNVVRFNLQPEELELHRDLLKEFFVTCYKESRE